MIGMKRTRIPCFLISTYITASHRTSIADTCEKWRAFDKIELMASQSRIKEILIERLGQLDVRGNNRLRINRLT